MILLGAAVTVPAHIIIVFTLTLARETRLFFPPFLFVIPVVLWLFEDLKTYFINFCRKFWGALALSTGIMSFWVGLVAAPALFPAFDFRGRLEFSQFYLGIHIGLSLIFLVFLLYILLRSLFRIR